MRLLKALDPDIDESGDLLPELVDFPPDRIPEYAILSHRWGAPEDEVLFADITSRDPEHRSNTRRKRGYNKVAYSCRQAREDGLEYVWIDTCCINKDSSAELSEAINSMYAWYEKAAICYAYLEDVPATIDTRSEDSELTNTTWATRGWTLQELLAPSEMVFYSEDWVEIGTKDTLSYTLSKISGIDEAYLTKRRPLESASLAKRMSWAATRQTSRPEDIAYCLMGIFSVNMPMLYGEGNKAFLRLQEEIMRHSDDHSLFAWTDEDLPDDSYHGLFADHPKQFKYSNSIIPYQDREFRPPFSMSNRGLRIELHLTNLADSNLFAAALDCPVPPNFEDSSFLAIYLRRLPIGHSQYARVKVGRFGEVHERGGIQTIYIRQSIIVPDLDGVYPSHIFQLRQFAGHGGDYRIAQVLIPSPAHQARAITSSNTTKLPPGNPSTCKIVTRGENRVCCVVHVVYNDTESFLILLGSTAGFRVGFDAVEIEQGISILSPDLLFSNFLGAFSPVPMGAPVTTGYHRVHVSAEPVLVGAAKYYMIDMKVDAVRRPVSTLDALRDVIEELIGPQETLPMREPSKGHRFRKLRNPFRG